MEIEKSVVNIELYRKEEFTNNKFPIEIGFI